MEKTEEFLKPDQSYSDILKISPFAFAKMIFWRDCGNTEVAAYATTKTRDPLFITDFRLIKQECMGITFDLDTNDLAEDVERTLDDGLCPWQTHNILCHSHPGNSPNPSSTDEANFAKAFSHPDWAIMLIIAQDNSTYCRLKVNIGPGIVKELKVEIDWSVPFNGSDIQLWNKEYESKVSKKVFRMTEKEKVGNGVVRDVSIVDCDPNDPLWWNDEHEKWANFQPEFEELDCHWDENGDVVYWNDDDAIWYIYDPVNHKWSIWDGDEENLSVETPKEPWTAKVIAWAEKYIHERNVAIEYEVVLENDCEM